MKTELFDYYLPKKLIAQDQVEPRDHSKLMVLKRSSDKIKHEHFYNIGKYLKEGDVLVLNDSKVIPARLIGRKEGNGRPIEIFLLKPLSSCHSGIPRGYPESINNIDSGSKPGMTNTNLWQCLIGGKKRQLIREVSFNNSKLKANILKDRGDGTWKVDFNLTGNSFWREVEKIGQIPTPPYIKSHKQFKTAEKDYYQTIYARKKGSVAAPTAGFHFTEKLVKELKKRGVEFVFITLHVGLGTFAPIRVSDVDDHKMHTEVYEVSKKAASSLNKAISANRRIIAVGTTSARVLESAATTPLPRSKKFLVSPLSSKTNLFIKPGYKFKVVDGLITNFHLPRSSLLLLVSAFAGRKEIMNAYKKAIEKHYRFYSFGDCMMII